MNRIWVAVRWVLGVALLWYVPVPVLAADTKKVVEPPRLVVQTGHGSMVQSVAFSPDGKTLVSGSDDKSVKLWDLITGHELCRACSPMPCL